MPSDAIFAALVGAITAAVGTLAANYFSARAREKALTIQKVHECVQLLEEVRDLGGEGPTELSFRHYLGLYPRGLALAQELDRQLTVAPRSARQQWGWLPVAVRRLLPAPEWFRQGPAWRIRGERLGKVIHRANLGDHAELGLEAQEVLDDDRRRAEADQLELDRLAKQAERDLLGNFLEVSLERSSALALLRVDASLIIHGIGARFDEVPVEAWFTICFALGDALDEGYAVDVARTVDLIRRARHREPQLLERLCGPRSVPLSGWLVGELLVSTELPVSDSERAGLLRTWDQYLRANPEREWYQAFVALPGALRKLQLWRQLGDHERLDAWLKARFAEAVGYAAAGWPVAAMFFVDGRFDLDRAITFGDLEVWCQLIDNLRMVGTGHHGLIRAFESAVRERSSVPRPSVMEELA